MKHARIVTILIGLASMGEMSAGAPGSDVDLRLSLLVDVSGSVNDTEYALMMTGFASAFENSAVHAAIGRGDIGAIAVNMVQFASLTQEVIDWTLVDDAVSANALAAILRSTPNAGLDAPGPSTGIGNGIGASAATFPGSPFSSDRNIIDVSGDGVTSVGTPAATARDNALAGGITTINGIVISDDDGEILAHYEDEVIGGANAFATSAATFEDFEQEILRKILAEITGRRLGSFPIPAVIRQAHLMLVRNGYQDINSRLFRLRAGERGPGPETLPGEVYRAPLSDKGGKGGMAKGGQELLGPPTTTWKRWEVFGSVGYFTSEVDEQAIVPGQVFVPGFDVDAINGTVGIEYDVNRNWSLGAAVVGSDGEADIDGGSDIDIQDLGLAVYASYFRADAFNAMGAPADFWADLLYGYNSGEYDTKRVTVGGLANGSTDTSSHLVEFNAGLNISNGSVIHGPYAGLAFMDGEVDAFTETGPGAVSYPEVDIESTVSTLGYQVSFPMETARGKVVPQVRAAWEHEFEDGP
ncbi:MAG: DUF1194 domain-containing protein, partial [Akkermansiaceae bacterium]|nr:DUF1194 domain-containing protein [Akkermansiaceae bacterium]